MTEMNGSFCDFGWGHLGCEGARTNELIEFLFKIIGSGGNLFDMGGTDGLVGLLSAGGFGFKILNF